MKRLIFILTFLQMLVGVAYADKPVKIRDLYNKGLSLSQFAIDNEGKYIEIEGYMAPPLLAESTFFVLTKIPMAVCPFCETDADWPDDILAIYTKRTIKVRDFNEKITIKGKLMIGKFVDKETGFVSMLRLENSLYD